MRHASTLLGLGLLVAGCGLPGAPLAGGPALAAECGPVPLDWPVPNPPYVDFEPFEGDLDEYVDENARIEFDMDTPTVWSVVEESGSELLLFGRHTVDPPAGPSYRYARFEKVGDGWRASAWGGCQIEASASGYGVATFQLDPTNRPDPSSTTLDVLAIERACASGEAPIDREVIPLVVENEDYIDITILVESPFGFHTCQGMINGFPLKIDLDEPIGNRTVRDLGLHPAEARTWPPDETLGP